MYRRGRALAGPSREAYYCWEAETPQPPQWKRVTFARCHMSPNDKEKYGSEGADDTAHRKPNILKKLFYYRSRTALAKSHIVCRAEQMMRELMCNLARLEAKRNIEISPLSNLLKVIRQLCYHKFENHGLISKTKYFWPTPSQPVGSWENVGWCLSAQPYGLCFIVCKALYAKMVGVKRFTMARSLPNILDLPMAKSLCSACTRSRNRLWALVVAQLFRKPHEAKMALAVSLFSPPKGSFVICWILKYVNKACIGKLHNVVMRCARPSWNELDVLRTRFLGGAGQRRCFYGIIYDPWSCAWGLFGLEYSATLLRIAYSKAVGSL